MFSPGGRCSSDAIAVITKYNKPSVPGTVNGHLRDGEGKAIVCRGPIGMLLGSLAECRGIRTEDLKFASTRVATTTHLLHTPWQDYKTGCVMMAQRERFGRVACKRKELSGIGA